ncbi:uncharacterized protein [Ptychodera flava]|uniref:uncharacterized protein isoform X2 n=1 Tax=Ptychodera flava TaxID=63121 RepID=UPI003969E5EB
MMLPISVASPVGVSLVLFATTVAILVFFSGRKTWNRWKLQTKKNRIILFTRYPTPGLTKTRLIGELGETGAARLQHYMTDHMVDVVTNVQQHCPDICVEIDYCGGNEQDIKYWFDRKTSLKCIWNEQQPGNLGDKMSSAFRNSFQQGAENVLIIGSDIPGINRDLLREAFTTLQDSATKDNLLLGPALDGGYYLIGLNQINSSKLENLLQGIDWGTEKVREQQEERAKSVGISVCHLSKVLQDVDTIDDLPVVEEFMGISVQQIKSPRLSVVIPVLNGVDEIQNAIATLIKRCSWPQFMEIIVCDGGSEDGTFEKVEEIAKSETKCPIKVVRSSRGRGKQQNAGFSHSSGDVLLFLHADTLVPERFFEEILLVLGTPGVSAGAYALDFDKLYSDKMIRWTARKRATKYELPYGDQGIFLTRQMFEKLGGFPDYPLMEDYELVKRLQKEGHVKICEESPAITSAKRWEKYGFSNTLQNYVTVIAYEMGVKPATLARWYYGSSQKKNK